MPFFAKLYEHDKSSEPESKPYVPSQFVKLFFYYHNRPVWYP